MKKYTLLVALALGIYLLRSTPTQNIITPAEHLSTSAQTSLSSLPLETVPVSPVPEARSALSEHLDASPKEVVPTKPQDITTPIANVLTEERLGGEEARGAIAFRIKNPYTNPPYSFDTVNSLARKSLVNILCVGGDAVRPTSGSGVIIDSRGIILTNAHVAQYVLLSEDPRINLSCAIRTGTPAYPTWKVRVMYMPETWVTAHAHEINASLKLGTGEHDYALLQIVSDIHDTPVNGPFPSLAIDTRERIAFPPDTILTASYPAELVGGIIAQKELYPVTSITEVKSLATFGSGTIDAFTLGSTIGAQSGSSGGAVVNAWGYLVGIISTMSPGQSTDERVLRAITLSSITRDIKKDKGIDLETFIARPIEQSLSEFDETKGALLNSFIETLTH